MLDGVAVVGEGCFVLKAILLSVDDEVSGNGVFALVRLLAGPSGLSLGSVSSTSPLGDNLIGILVPLGGALLCCSAPGAGSVTSIEPAFGIVSFSQNEVIACCGLASFFGLFAAGALTACEVCGALVAKREGWLVSRASSLPVSGPLDKTVATTVLVSVKPKAFAINSGLVMGEFGEAA